MKILQITLLLLFVSFNSFAQNNEAKKMRSSVISNSEVTKLEKLIFNYEFIKNEDSAKYFSELKEKASNYAKNDTLILFSTGFIGENSRKGVGEYDSITSKYSFFYKDIYTDCLTGGFVDKALDFYNSIIENEIAKRYNENWEKKCKTEIIEAQNKENIRTGRRIDFKILVNDKVVDTLYIDKIEDLKINILNQKKINEYVKRDIVATISFAKGRKLVSQYENVKSENIESILKNEFKIKSIDEIDRIVIEFSNIYYNLGLYVYPIK